MTGHLTLAELNALADTELTPEQLAIVSDHLAGCPSCTASALSQSLLKSATAKAGHRYTPPAHLRERISLQTNQEAVRQESMRSSGGAARAFRTGLLGWAAAAAVLLVAATSLFVERNVQQKQIATTEFAALATEVSDQHIAALAASSPPQVISTDRHTVKPWFQGKLPFSFNLPDPDGLPTDTRLDGANLAYIHGQPVAQLLYSIGKHRVSVFVTQGHSPLQSRDLVVEHAGFHVMAVRTNDLELIAVSDVEPSRLSDLINAIGRSQSGAHEDAR
jgi:anti-sigma factor RsiW